MSEPSALERSYEKMTSSALNGVPSWNLTFWRRLKRHTVGAVCFHDVASSGIELQLLAAADQRLEDVAGDGELQRFVQRVRIHRNGIALIGEPERRRRCADSAVSATATEDSDARVSRCATWFIA